MSQQDLYDTDVYQWTHAQAGAWWGGRRRPRGNRDCLLLLGDDPGWIWVSIIAICIFLFLARGEFAIVWGAGGGAGVGGWSTTDSAMT